MTKQDSFKSIRDIFIISIGASIPQVIEVLQVTDFGEYNALASVLFGSVAPMVYRLLRKKKY